MKLYTEEQIAEAVMFGRWGGTMKKDYEEFLNKLTPIKLPSDEEIKKEAIKQMEEWSGSGCEEEIFGFIKGAKWMRDKILNK